MDAQLPTTEVIGVPIFSLKWVD